MATYNKAVAAGDRAMLGEILTDDVEFVPPQSGPFPAVAGKDGVIDALLGGLTDEIMEPGTFKPTLRKMVVDGETAVMQLNIRANAKDSGADYDNQYAFVYTCRYGRVARIEEYTDTLYASRVFGW